ncbi:MAG: asparagine synthase (glutamine-hydrolyzing), partial [Cytophagales bacterium]|nr:asparagine synthase (glutamine-hydrolyzing) [Cytophagales bacterium]
MCGITGFFSPRDRFMEAHLADMTGLLRHRGPDADGVFFDGTCGLGHRRLSILDLSANANQPFYSRDRRYVIVYNGEVYNYREVAQQYGIVPRTTSDTEIIAEAFAQDGIHCVQYLNGMFAFAVYDTQQHVLWLCRDRLGIKPLFYYWDGTDLTFASELKALHALPLPRVVRESAVAEFLHRGFIPAPHTIYRNVYKLRPGHWLKVTLRGLEEDRYWSLAEGLTHQPVGDEKAAVAQVEGLLRDAVRMQLVSDVPVGVFLSGGIDSSTVAALAAAQLTRPLNTFSIGFDDERHNEAPFAREVAGLLHSNHYELMVTAQEAKDMLATMLDIYDEPYADSSAIPTMLVSRLARRHVGVVLTGDGGDELFHGYGMYAWAERLSQTWLRRLRHPLAGLLSVGRAARYQKAAGLLAYGAAEDIPSHIFAHEQGYFSYPELRSLMHGPLGGNGTLSALSHPPATGKRLLTPAETQSLFDLALYLPDDLLTKVDRASMHYGLEARVPLLDHRLVELALNLAPRLKNRNGLTKHVLKQVLYRYLPAEVFNRPKRGFSVPLHAWLRTDFRHLLADYLTDTVLNRYGYVDAAQVRRMERAFLAGNTYFYNRLWTLALLHR